MIIPLTGANQAIAVNAGTPLYYRGATLRETSGTATALVRIYDGTGAAGTVLEEFALTASQSTREYYDGMYAAIGIYVNVVNGAVEGSVRY